jgi:hypothetical protein
MYSSPLAAARVDDACGDRYRRHDRRADEPSAQRRAVVGREGTGIAPETPENTRSGRRDMTVWLANAATAILQKRNCDTSLRARDVCGTVHGCAAAHDGMRPASAAAAAIRGR